MSEDEPWTAQCEERGACGVLEPGQGRGEERGLSVPLPGLEGQGAESQLWAWPRGSYRWVWPEPLGLVR